MKKLVAMCLSVVMGITMGVPALAAEIEPLETMTQLEYKAAIRAEIMRQLEEQDAEHLYEAFEAVFLPESNGEQTRSSHSYYAPDGGYLYYTVPYTYRGEDGEYSYGIVHLDHEATNILMTSLDHTLTTATFLLETYGNALGNVVTGTAWWLFSIGQIGLNVSNNLVQQAGGVARIVTVEGSVDNSCATVVAGWNDCPYMVLESGATLCEVGYFPAD